MRLQETTDGARIAEILDTNGAVVETLVPSEFSQTLEIPDIENNSSEMVEQKVSGTDIVAAGLEESTGRILIAVRGFIYAEVSTDLVFLLEPDSPGGGTDDPGAIEPVYFDGPDAAAGETAPRPHLDVSRVSFGRAGHLIIETADASGGSSRLVYNAERVPESCTWKGGESRRCPKGVEAR